METIANLGRLSTTYKKPLIIGLGIIIVIFILLSIPSTGGYVVLVDGQQIGLIEDKSLVERVLDDLKVTKENQTDTILIGFKNDIEIVESKEKDGKILTADSLKAILNTQIQWIANGASIDINGNPQLYLKSLEEGQLLLGEVKEMYLPQASGVEVLQVDFEEQVTVSSAEVDLKQIIDYAKALELITNGTHKIEKYKIKKGDTLWDVALAHGLSVRELREANPQLKGDTLSIGQELNLIKSDPLINVVAVSQVTKEETIRFDTRYINTAELWRGQTKVEQRGQNGKKEVTYKIITKNDMEIAKEVLNETVLENPVTQVVQRGTQVMVASRGGGTGELAWPLRGAITSGYGRRGTTIHTGIDINGSTGDGVFAAEAGRVIFAAWRGNYGYCIDIDHGDGLLTRYAHLSKIEVSIGQQVTRGQLIGRVGSTGKSTGPHLHFEVRVNGNHTNPLRYLN